MNLTMPLGEHGDMSMLWTSERRPGSCFGADAYARPGPAGGLSVQRSKILSPTLAHSCVASSLMWGSIAQGLSPPGAVTAVTLWPDVGTRLRESELIGLGRLWATVHGTYSQLGASPSK